MSTVTASRFAITLGFSLLVVAPGMRAAEDSEGVINEQKIQKIVSEAQQMASEWSYKFHEMRGGKDTKSTYMGIVIESVPDVLRDYIDLPEGIGLLMTHISKDGPADKAGLKDNDILVTFGGQLIVNFNQLSTLIEYNGPGASVPVKILRKGEEMEFTVVLEERVRKGGRLIAPDVPEPPEPPDPPGLDLPEGEDIGRYMEKVEEWIPGSVSLYIDENEQIQVDLQDLKESLQDLRVKIREIQRTGGDKVSEIRKEHGGTGARTTIVHVDDSNVNFQNRDGKLLLTSSRAGQQAMIWNPAGELIYQGVLPEDLKSELPDEAVRLIKAYQDSRRHLEMNEPDESLKIHMNEEGIDSVTLLAR